MRAGEKSSKSRDVAARLLPVIGLGALFGTLLISSSTVNLLIDHSNPSAFIKTFSVSETYAAAVISAVCAIFIFLRKQIPSRLLQVSGAVLYIVGSLCFLYFSFYEIQNELIVIAGATICGAGCVALCLVWGRVFSRFHLKQALINVSVACLIAIFIHGIEMWCPREVDFSLFIALTVLAVAIPGFIGIPSSLSSEAPTKGYKLKTTETLKSLAVVMVEPALGLFFFAFAVALLRGDLVHSYNLYLLAFGLSSLILLGYSLIKRHTFTIRSLYQTFVSLLAIILLAAMSLSPVMNFQFRLITFLVFLLSLFSMILAVSIFCAIANAAEFSTDLIFSLAIFVFSLSSGIGQHISRVFLVNKVDIALVITTTLYAFLMIAFSYNRWRQANSWNNEHLEPKEEIHSLDEKCSTIADRYRLTSREYEIFSYLAKGHSGTYIAETLLISPNTARTHIHNIYRKLDISSREDILRLVHMQDSDKSQT